MKQGFVVPGTQSQLVYLPQSAALPSDAKIVDVIVIGRARIIAPAGKSWDSWFDGDGVSADFMAEREEPSAPEREDL